MQLPSWPAFGQEEIDAVARVLSSGRVNYWTGEEGRHFEREFAAFAGTRHAIALSNGTAALELALHGLGIGVRNGGSADDEVIVTPRSFVASVSAVVHAGARPVFADVDVDSGNIEAATVAPVIGPRTRAIVPVHLAGFPVDMRAMMALAEANELFVIEDCAQAHGAAIDGRSVGSFGHVGTWSFCQDKIMTTGGEGGMVTCDDEALWRRMWAFKDHGKSYAAVFERDHAPGFRWLHESIGTNYRMTEMQAAIGRLQLGRMEQWMERRRDNARILAEALEPLVLKGLMRVPQPPAGFDHAAYKFYAYIEPGALPPGCDRDALVAAVEAADVPCFQGSCSEIYREAAFRGTDFAPTRPLPVSRRLGDTSMVWLVHPTIDATTMEEVARRSVEAIEARLA